MRRILTLSSIAKYYRVCPVCQMGGGSIGLHLTEWLCPSCYEYFLKEARIFSHKAPMYNKPVHCLVLWNKENQEFISRLIQSLKGNYNYSGWQVITQILIREMILNNLFYWKEAEVIVPAPSHNENRQHAQVFAQALSRQLNIPVDLDLLSFKKEKISWFHFKKIQNNRQAFKSKNQRAEIQIVAKKHKYKKILFVDDICTTGSTISAVNQTLSGQVLPRRTLSRRTSSRRALGRLSYFQPLVLACKVKTPI